MTISLEKKRIIYSNKFTEEEITKAYKVGVMGWSSIGFDEKLAREKLYDIFVELRKKHKSTISIVSGWSNIGIPKIATELAKEFGFICVGFSAESVLQYDLCEVDVGYIVGKNFGDESESFIKYIDEVIKLGGGLQSENEVNLAIESNKKVTSCILDKILK